MNENIDKLNFEDCLNKLEESAAKIKSGELSLEDSMSVYDNSILLYNRCKELLDKAKQKIEIYDRERNVKEEFNEY